MVLQEKSETKITEHHRGKIHLLEAIGIQNLVIHPFDAIFSNTC
jgi:riboflavin kinase/FMN adenylyltransferase